MSKDFLDLAPDVAEALATGKAVVALESTIVTHGMPWPENVETARQVEDAVRAREAVPATIAVIGGRIKIGLSADELDLLAQAKDVRKLSRADLAYAVSARLDGSTTVAATMIAAHLAGIVVFATGGIGGVHRGAETSFDISADLDELARTPVAVVCAGAKAILDVPKTLEVLETRGVPVVCCGTGEFPAFWSRQSGLAAPIRLDTPDEIAALIETRNGLNLEGGTLVANPLSPEDEIPAVEIGRAIETALERAYASGVTGKDVTPFLLSQMLELTDGRSLVANIALIKANAALAAQIAVALTKAKK